MTIRICFVGKMASGKSTAAAVTQEVFPDVKRASFADPVKKIAVEHFNMTFKDRRLLQIIGGTGRALNPTTWIDRLIATLKPGQSYVVDDARYAEECLHLRNHGFVVVYLEVDAKTRIERLKKTYGDQAQQHVDSMNGPSENQLRGEDADIVWKNLSTDEVREKIQLLKNIMTTF